MLPASLCSSYTCQAAHSWPRPFLVSACWRSRRKRAAPICGKRSRRECASWAGLKGGHRISFRLRQRRRGPPAGTGPRSDQPTSRRHGGGSGQSADAAHRATKTVPIVLAGVGNAVGAGLVASLAKPGGNVTGFTSQQDEVLGKLIGILHEVVPSARRNRCPAE